MLVFQEGLMPALPSRRRFLAAAAASGLVPPVAAEPGRSKSAPSIDWGYPAGAVRVGLNENPLGPSPLAVQAMSEALVHGNRYPRLQPLVDAVAKRHDVDPAWVVLACGSTELLRALPGAFAAEGEIVSAREAYRVAPSAAEKAGIPVRWVPVDKQYRHDLTAMAAAVSNKTRVVLVSNPNNPTGTAWSAGDIRRFAAAVPATAVCVIDEAYVDYAPEAEASSIVKEHKNALVLRTFSKIFGLAGLRVGYALGHPDLIARLQDRLVPYNINAVGFAGATAALQDAEHIRRSHVMLEDGRTFWERTLKAMGLGYVPTRVPFFLLDTGREGDAVAQKLRAQNVFVRRGGDWDLPRHVRISFGVARENEAVAAALKAVLS
jgi:histidinol-phosphate aminotransferase